MSRLPLFFISLLAVFFTANTYAVTLEELVKKGEVKLEIKIADEGDYVVGQELTGTIKFATQTWFKGANKFVLPEVGNAVVMQRDSFGTNETRRIDGINWVMQEKRFSIFPQATGEYTIPAIKVSMKVFVDGEGDVSGEAYTKPLTFNVFEPAELVHVEQWWAANSLSIEESWDKNFSTLKPGYSIQRTITIEADGVLAMMLPEINHPPISGLAHYLKTPQLIDDNTRGNKLGKRIQSIDYVVEESGEVTIPAIELTWYNIDTQSIEYARLEERIIVVGELSPQEKMLKLAKQAVNYWKEILVVILLLIILGAIWQKFKSNRVKPRYQSKHVKGHLALASYDKDNRRFIKWAYIYLDWFVSPNKVNVMRNHENEQANALDDNFDSVFGKESKPASLSSLYHIVTHKKHQQHVKSKEIDLSMNPK